MATKNETNTKDLPSFSSIKGHERRAVILRAEGRTYAQVTANINDEFALDYAEPSVREWFVAGGRLEQAYNDFVEAQATAALREARQTIKRASNAAAATLVSLLKPGQDPRLQLDAAKSILNKYLPDKQIVLDAEGEDELPDELADVGDDVLDGEEDDDGPVAVDDTPQGEAPGRSDGKPGGKDLPAEVLPEPAAADRSGDPAA